MQACARAGFAIRGVLYLVMGALAARVALSARGHAAGSVGALQSLAHQQFGRGLLILSVLGLGGFATWCLWRTFRLRPRPATGWQSLWLRFDFFVGFIIHALLVVGCAYLLFGYEETDPTGDRATRYWTATLMSYPTGRWVIGITGLYLIGAGIGQVYTGITCNLREPFDLDHLGRWWRRAAVLVSRTGIAARGVVLGLVGVFLALAAWREDPAAAHGIGGALDELERRPSGPWLLGLLAAGLIAYGIYELVVRTLCRRAHTI